MEEAMTDTTSAPTKPPEPTDAAPAPESRPAPPARSAPKHAGSELVTDEGRTSIADSVVAKIAGVAAREVSGVHAMGGGASRAFGAIREAVGTSSASQGVSVEVGERQAAIDLTLVVEYGASIVDLADGVRSNVIDRTERMTGLEVTEVNIAIDDVHLPDAEDHDDRPEPPRVQ
jgi:uncharacterized alkaline shock family protein YloU